MRIEIVGGTWDKDGGKPSKVLKMFIQGIEETGLFNDNSPGFNVGCFNGGYLKELHNLLDCPEEEIRDCDSEVDIIVWMPNVGNEEAKERDVKKHFPHCVLITSKRNLEGKYTFSEVVAHGLSLRSQLVLEVLPRGRYFAVRLLDTLGNVWYEGSDWIECGRLLAHRAVYLASVTRQGTVQSPERMELPCPTHLGTQLRMRDINEFTYEVVRDAGKIFHKLINPAKGVERFLGNASFRCEYGFPSMCIEGNIFVSKRNVDKTDFDLDSFVQVGLNKETKELWYRGDNKPSVDTPIQVRLYQKLPRIHFMLHSHVYVNGSPMTSTVVPCGALEEVKEIFTVIHQYDFQYEPHFAINLVGHGSIIFMGSPSDYNEYSPYFIKRPWPEHRAV